LEQVKYHLLIEKEAGRLVAKGKRLFKNRLLIEKRGKKPSIRLERAPDGFVEMIVNWNALSPQRKVVPSTLIRFLLLALLNQSKGRELFLEGRKQFFLYTGQTSPEFFKGLEKLIKAIPNLQRISFRKLLRG